MKIVLAFLVASLCLAACDSQGLKVYYNVTDEDYFSIPPVFHLDDFDACMSIKSKPTLFCYITLVLSPPNKNNVTPVWSIIQELNSSARTYRHDLLRHGVCLPKTLPNISNKYYSSGNGSEELWKQISLHYSKQYWGMEGTVVNLFCQDNANIYNVDYVDILYAIMVGILALLIVTATLYEYLAKQQTAKVYEMSTKTHTLRKLITAFSLTKNWQRLRGEYSSEDAKALAPIQGIRVFNTYFVVLAHTIMLLMHGPIQNTKYVEDATLKMENMFISNGPFICQTFFMFSGWFLSYQFCVHFENKEKIRWKHLFIAFINRYLRLAPILLLAVGFSATWLRHLGDGPLWEHYVGDEFRNCRNHWWTNMIFINNVYKPGEMCLQQTWYIACDTQNFIVGLLIIMLVFKYPQHAMKIFVTFILLGLIISVGHTYYMNYDIVYRSYPEIVYHIYLKYPQWLDTYLAGHFSLPAYVQGMACGYYFHKYRRENKAFLEKKIAIYAWLIFIWVTPIATILLAGTFYQDGYHHIRWQAALYHGLCRYLFIFPISIAIFGFTLGLGWHMISVCTWRPLQTIARVSFSMYITHVWFIRLRVGTMRTLLYLNNYKILIASLGDFTMALIGGTVVCLAVEMPLSAIQKIIMEPKKVESEIKTE